MPHQIHLNLRGVLGVSLLITSMLFIWVKVAKVAACVFSTGYAHMFKLDAVATMVIHTVILNCVKLLTKFLSHLSLPHPVPLNMIDGALNTRIIG
jgi:hypothetical protein